jgi:hypothetical protein
MATPIAAILPIACTQAAADSPKGQMAEISSAEVASNSTMGTSPKFSICFKIFDLFIFRISLSSRLKGDRLLCSGLSPILSEKVTDLFLVICHHC